MEVAGLVMASIQMTLEIYNRVGPRISAYRNYRKKVDRSIIHLVSQQTIFELCGNDLIQALGQHREKLDSWFTQPKHSDQYSTPSTLITPEDFCKQIGHCERLVLSIKNSLEMLGTELDRFSLKIENQHKGLGLLRRLAYASFKKDESFLEAVRELVRLNQSFCAIAAGIIKRIEWVVATGSQSSLKDSKKWSVSDMNTITKYRRIRSASTKLYETITEGWLCDSHQSHSVSVAFVEGNPQPDVVKFDIAVSVTEENPITAPNPLWLEIQHSEPLETPKDTGANSVETQQLFTTAVVNGLDAAINKKLLSAQSDATLSVRTPIPSTPPKTSTNSTTKRQPQRSERDLAASVNNFCQHFMTQYQTNPSRSECLGLIRKQQQYLQKCYLPPQDRRYTGRVLSLDALISWAKEQATIRALDRPLVSKLAKHLAISILHFHSTPWLCDSWKSSNIKFFDRGGFLDCELNPSPPHLQVTLETTGSTVSSTFVGSNSTKLFLDFAKALLQIGFSSSWESLRDKISRHSGVSNDPDRNATHYVASQLCKQVKRKLGIRYARVVESCIDADMKALYSSEEEQVLFFVDVVGVMKDLDESWQKFQQSLA
ncbi:hypothetical protein QBC38DRAFT_548324 [Podospora fimiseda]|uniref:DUF7580 domain-containing protein n=1 Tax=Podospora fimiseda TaxID=252190 RepID=A0AAN7GXW0_9PEZI|nr:hypothetical protein QBC38DRAFT_548324 [Podospora fimiseda]